MPPQCSLDSAQVTSESPSPCRNTSFFHNHPHTCTFTAGALKGSAELAQLCLGILRATSATTSTHSKIPIIYTSLWLGREPHFPVICPKKGFYFSSGERAEYVGGKRLSTGIHFIHFTSCPLYTLNLRHVCMFNMAGRGG